jgi:hypothetical protein
MWLILSFAQVSRIVEQIVHTTFSFPNSSSEADKLQFCGRWKILLSFLMQIDGHFWPIQQQQQGLPQFKSILDSQLSRHIPAFFRLQIENCI